MTPHYDEVFDVVVNGSGFAGLAAAIEAKDTGASTMVLGACPRMHSPPTLRYFLKNNARR